MRSLALTPIDVGNEPQVDAVHRLVAADEVSVVGFTEETPESTRGRLVHPDAHAPSHRLAWRDGQPVGVLLVECDRHGREVFLDAYAPVPDRVEVLETLLQEGLASALTIARDGPDTERESLSDPIAPTPAGWMVEAGCYGQDDGYARALSLVGFTAERRFWRMRQDLTGVSSTEPPAPAGVTRRTVSGDDDRHRLHALFCASFAEHYGTSNDRPFAEWIASVEAAPGADPERWWIASQDGVDVALCILDDSRASLDCGYVRTLGVVPEARGHGVARWLLGCAAADSVARGRAELMLTVDGENTTGATMLYESVGYRIDEVIDLWRRSVADPAACDSADSR